MSEFDKKFPKPEIIIINIDATNEICRLIHEKKCEGWLEAKKDVLDILQDMLSYHDKNPWESIRDLENGLIKEIEELEKQK